VSLDLQTNLGIPEAAKNANIAAASGEIKLADSSSKNPG
jgi:hypothetical protein